jgi:hypothetical protein
MDFLRWAWVACVLALGTGCHTQDAVLLTVGADSAIEQYQLFVHDDETESNVYASGFVAVSRPGDLPIDLTHDKLKLALKLSRGGRFTLLLVGVIGQVQDGRPAANATRSFWATRLAIDGATNISAELITVPTGADVDGDYWPDAQAFLAQPAAQKLYAGKTELLDCDDAIDYPLAADGKPIALKASQINPFAVEICGDGYDENCDGNGDEACVDKDGDHDVRGHDCDDSDPKRHHPTSDDPYPDPPNCCGYSLGKIGTPDENTNFLGKPICPFKRCGDGIDESCRGIGNDPKNDTTCVVDNDCDGYPPPPQGNDCDDNDPAVHPGAYEPCGATKDYNCDGTIGEGCVPCDVDGDGFERAGPGCPDNKDKHPGQVDCNDDDAGVFPGATAKAGGKEGGTSAIAKLAVGLLGLCRQVYEPIKVTGTPKINATGGLVGDADCNGKAYENCPAMIDPLCDVDGDGWPGVSTVNGKNCNPDGVTLDCDDNDPTTYPSAPDNCKTAKAENCASPLPDCSGDADGDGYVGSADCDDKNPDVHPFAFERCNGIDDDCDGLVDEGNPDPSGAPLVQGTSITACTDSDTGECAKGKGSCVCSITQPVKDPLIATLGQPRTMCPGEGISGKAPGCFGAAQPKPQSCDSTMPKDDDCDGRLDAPDGARLAIKGMPCGISVGQCKAGTVVACDMTQTNCFSAFGRTAPATSWYVCSTAAPNPITICPKAEECNGLDDDCDGHLPGDSGNAVVAGDEADHDRDGYLACSGCGATLAAGVTGCGDCNDTRPDIHPGAVELCDGDDNACVGPGFVDGKDDCGQPRFGHQSLPNCCGKSGCKNTSDNNTGQFCGTCTNNCDSNLANSCVGGMCYCGPKPECSGTLACTAGVCTQGPGSLCMNDSECTPQTGQSGGRCIDNHCCKLPDNPDGSRGSCGVCKACSGSGGVCMPQKANMPGNRCPDGTGNTVCDGSGQCALKTGAPCGSPGMNCWNGLCFDGFCCNIDCSRQCEQCNLQGQEGTCVARSGRPVSPRTACAGANTPCLGMCDGTDAHRDACQYPGPTTACPSVCTPGSGSNPASVATASCNGGGVCVTAAPGACNNHNRLCNADGTGCATSCNGDSDCVTNYFCDGTGTCRQRVAQGIACDETQGTTAATCKSTPCQECAAGPNQCVDKVCCNVTVTSCMSACAFCNAPSSGSCVAARAGTTPRIDCNGLACDGLSTSCPVGKCTGDSDCITGDFCDNTGSCTKEIATGSTCKTDNSNCLGKMPCRQCQGDQPCPNGGTCT